MDNSVNESLKMLFSKMEDFVSTKTVVGEAVHIGDVILIPLVDVSFGMSAGSSAAKGDNKGKDMGGGGVGAKMTPAAMVVIVNGTVQLVNVKHQESVNKMIDMIPGILSKLGFDSLIEKFLKKDKEEESEKESGSPDGKINAADDENGEM